MKKSNLFLELSILLSVFVGFTTACDNTPKFATATSNAIKIATWNIYWLADSSNNVRSAGDYTLLNGYAKELHADVVAMEETENSVFAEKVFGADYDYYFSDRPGGPGTQRVGFAVKRASGIKVESFKDYSDLDVGGVRYGMDLTVSRNNKSIRLLAVHLKSGCFESPLDDISIANMPTTSVYEQDLKNACSKLAQQKAPLERWVDARAKENLPFMVLGDFNRRFEVEDEKGYTEEQGLWATIDDPGATNPYEDLTRLNDNLTPQCWSAHFSDFIDHIIVDPRAKDMVVHNSFNEMLYSQSSYNDYYQILSDHCPISVLVKL
jgi:exonuclease III